VQEKEDKVTKRPHDRLTVEQVRSCLNYDPLTGIFTWRITQGNRIAGAIAGTPSHERRTIQIFGCRQPAAVVAWLHFYGKWPEREVDHKNLNAMDDRISNLREATISQNGMNKGIRKDSSTGFKGVSVDSRSGKYVARISDRNGTRKLLGYFPEPEQASAAYKIAARTIYGEFARFDRD
jgi:hypothetical protein